MTSMGDPKRTFTYFAALVKLGSNQTYSASCFKGRCPRPAPLASPLTR